MSNFGSYFDVDSVQVNDNLEPGTYEIVYTESEIKEDSKKGKVQLEATYAVIAGPEKDRKGKEWLTIASRDNEVEQRIGQQNVKRIIEACGKPNAKDFSEVHNIPLTIERVEKAGKDGNKYVNTVKFLPHGQGEAKAQASGQGSTTTKNVPW